MIQPPTTMAAMSTVTSITVFILKEKSYVLSNHIPIPKLTLAKSGAHQGTLESM
jgi:hypothetical protein